MKEFLVFILVVAFFTMVIADQFCKNKRKYYLFIALPAFLVIVVASGGLFYLTK